MLSNRMRPTNAVTYVFLYFLVGLLKKETGEVNVLLNLIYPKKISF